MTGGPESNRCYFRGGKLENRMTTIPFVVGASVIITKDVPADVCIQCNEPIMHSDVASTIDHLLKPARRSEFELSVMTYTQPAQALA